MTARVGVVVLLLETAIEFDEAHYAPDHPKVAVRYSNLATVEQDLGPRAVEV